ncbi:SH3 domain-containing protein [Massariosphaeria phaeospora]|uniref:SH3 domain-containing protein n=1 Tax=Massariosphaeria phaeospora TaxID=100035 RepID=A0A7C8M167_9PLEO|nr:SH3 domain-containing protein [Massariosphaeria phaeospora]
MSTTPPPTSSPLASPLPAKAKANYPFTPSRPSELTLRENDQLDVFDISEKGWAYGWCVASGQSGWIPGSYVEVVEVVEGGSGRVEGGERTLWESEEIKK